MVINKYIIFLNQQEATDLIVQINSCMGFPKEGTNTWQDTPDFMCEFDLTTGDKTSIGYGVIIKDEILDCLTEQQKSEVLILPSNINTCVYNPIV